MQTYTPAEAQGNFSQAVNGGPDPSAVAFFYKRELNGQPNPTLAAQGIINPSSIDPVAQAYFKNGLIPTSASGFLFPTSSAIDNDNEYLGKLDYSISSRDTLTGTFTAHDNKLTQPFYNANVTGYNAANFLQTYSGNIGYTHVFTPSLLNEGRITAVRTVSDDSVPLGSLQSVTPATLGINITSDLVTGPPVLYFYGSGLTTGYSPTGLRPRLRLPSYRVL